MSYAVGMLVLGTFLVAMAPTSSAAAVCVKYVSEPIPEDSCDGLVCLGWTQSTGWQTCVPPQIDCLDGGCCHYDVAGHTLYYCPPPA